MANLVITTYNSRAIVKFNAFSEAANIDCASWPKSAIHDVHLVHDQSYIEIEMLNRSTWEISFQPGNDRFVVDSVNGVIPTDDFHLFQLLHDALEG